MVEQQPNEPPSGQPKLSLQDQLAAAEHWRNRELLDLEHWRANVGSVDDDRRLADSTAAQLAQMTLKSGFLLNGGALIAVPAFLALFEERAPGLVSQLAFAIGIFVLGLIFVSAATVAAFFAIAAEADRCHHLREVRAHAWHEGRAPAEEKRQHRLAREAAQAEVDLHAKCYDGRRAFAIACAILSLLIFPVGVAFAVVAFL